MLRVLNGIYHMICEKTKTKKKFEDDVNKLFSCDFTSHFIQINKKFKADSSSKSYQKALFSITLKQ